MVLPFVICRHRNIFNIKRVVFVVVYFVNTRGKWFNDGRTGGSAGEKTYWVTWCHHREARMIQCAILLGTEKKGCRDVSAVLTAMQMAAFSTRWISVCKPVTYLWHWLNEVQGAHSDGLRSFLPRKTKAMWRQIATLVFLMDCLFKDIDTLTR